LGNRIATDNYSPSDVKTQLEQANKEAQKQLEGAEMPS
jgi:hypothetical protein